MMIMQYAKGQLSHECQWGDCSAAFASRDDLERHELDHWDEVDEEEYCCETPWGPHQPWCGNK